VIRRTFRLGLWLGVCIGVGAILLRLLRTRTPDSSRDLGTPPAPTAPWPPLAVPKAAPAATPKGTAAAPTTTAWVDPEGKICPSSHPVKAKLSSGIFHVPGGLSYDRTNPERCYVDAAAAEADGLRASKR
jgi:micrococcal nuclease